MDMETGNMSAGLRDMLLVKIWGDGLINRLRWGFLPPV